MQDFSPIIAAFTAFLITYFVGKPLIPFLKRLRCRQEIREEGPKWHKAKEGTPTMGGIMMIIGFIAAVIISIMVSVLSGHYVSGELKNPLELSIFISGIILGLGMAAVGFIDDYIKVVKKRNLGLTAWQKTLLQMIVSAAFLLSLALGGMHTTYIPFIGDINIMSGFGIIFWPIALMFVYGFVNAVNLTDGIDGLASSVTLVAVCGIMFVSTVTASHFLNNLGCCALAGACLGFIMWNAHPAKVFMGDTGSLFLGGMVTAFAFGTGKPILLLLFGLVYLCEALSVVLQVFSFKVFHKRIFKMSPIHHHFEMSGWKENKIVFVFSSVTFITSAIAVLLAKLY